jgi:hypothetical protein
MLSVPHCTDRFQHKRSEVSHEGARSWKRHMCRFKSPEQVSRFRSAHGPVQNLLRLGRHFSSASNVGCEFSNSSSTLHLQSDGKWCASASRPKRFHSPAFRVSDKTL